MTTIADAVKAQDVREDKLYYAAEQVQGARCLPQEAKDAIIKHISDARAKHPLADESADDAQPSISDTRPSKFQKAATAVAKKASS